MSPGDAVLVRSIYNGNVRWCFPHRFVGEEAGRFLVYLQPGSSGRQLGHADGHLVRWAAGDPPGAHVWQVHHVLWLIRPGDEHMLGLFWRDDWEFAGWYVNLQAPNTVNGRCFDSCDWALDVVVDPGGSWEWKDEDDFAHAQDLGILDPAAAAAVRAEGERVIAERPWPTGWENWRPSPDWEPLSLPEDWHVV